MLYGHLNPEHLVKELTNLAITIWKVRNSDSAEGKEGEDVPESSPSTPRHVRKRQKHKHSMSPPLSSSTPPGSGPRHEQLNGVLDGLQVVIIHCKEDLRCEYDRPVNLIIADQVRGLVDKQGLGAVIVAAVQGMHLCQLLLPSFS